MNLFDFTKLIEKLDYDTEVEIAADGTTFKIDGVYYDEKDKVVYICDFDPNWRRTDGNDTDGNI